MSLHELRRPLTQREKIAAFIVLAKNLEVLISNEQWSEDVWEVGSNFRSKGQNRQRRCLAFFEVDAKFAPRTLAVTGCPLPENFKDFSKAYIRFTHSASPCSFHTISTRLLALRFIAKAFSVNGLEANVERINGDILNLAVTLAVGGVNPRRGHEIALAIRGVHKFCHKQGFLGNVFLWKHGIKTTRNHAASIGGDAKSHRDEKMPSAEAIRALASIFRNSKEHTDQLFSAMTAIMLSVPIRIHEVLQLRNDCEVSLEKDQRTNNGHAQVYGLRVFPGKGNPPQVKWVPSPMVPIVKEAVSRIRNLTSAARALAKWLEDNRKRIYLPISYAHCRDQGWISLLDLASICNLKNSDTAAIFLRSRGLDVEGVGDGKRGVSFSVFEAKLSEILPTGFPYYEGDRHQLYSDTLILSFFNQTHRTRATVPILLGRITIGAFNNWLNGGGCAAKKSVFERWGFAEKDGQPIKISSHSFRHWLNTVSHLSGMSDVDVALWSGRRVDQNNVYNHVTDQEIHSQIKAAMEDGTGMGPVFDSGKHLRDKKLSRLSEFNSAQIGSSHITAYGVCVHDFSMLPCQYYGDCLNCSENVIIKGDKDSIVRLERIYLLSQNQLKAAEAASADEYFGADRWVISHKKALERMKEVLDFHHDTNFPDGLVVSLPPNGAFGELGSVLSDINDT